MRKPVIYHNPRCSKSRRTLELLKARGLEPEVVEYLKTPPSIREIALLLSRLGMSAKALMRTGEDSFDRLQLDEVVDEAVLIRAMHDHPELIERPIVVMGDSARIGRPPEAVLEIL